MDNKEKETKEYLKENFPEEKCSSGCQKKVTEELREEAERKAYYADMADADFNAMNQGGDSTGVDEEYEARFLDAEDEKVERETKDRIRETVTK